VSLDGESLSTFPSTRWISLDVDSNQFAVLLEVHEIENTLAYTLQ